VALSVVNKEERAVGTEILLDNADKIS